MVQDSPNWSILQIPTGPFDYFEVYGTDFDEERLIPADADSVIGFVVDDLEGAYEESRAAGVETTDIVWAADAFENPDLKGYGWFFLRAPDGNTYVMQQVPHTDSAD